MFLDSRTYGMDSAKCQGTADIFWDQSILRPCMWPALVCKSIMLVCVFEFFDFITLDDGEAPTEQLLKYIHQEVEISDLKRTFTLIDGKVEYINNPLVKDYKFSEVGTPDYTDLHLDQYISVIEVVNPMHRLWSDGRWNKLTMAHGCYW